MPALPGAQNTCAQSGDCAMRHTKACSLPPDPMTSTRTEPAAGWSSWEAEALHAARERMPTRRRDAFHDPPALAQHKASAAAHVLSLRWLCVCPPGAARCGLPTNLAWCSPDAPAARIRREAPAIPPLDVAIVSRRVGSGRACCDRSATDLVCRWKRVPASKAKKSRRKGKGGCVGGVKVSSRPGVLNPVACRPRGSLPSIDGFRLTNQSIDRSIMHACMRAIYAFVACTQSSGLVVVVVVCVQVGSKQAGRQAGRQEGRKEGRKEEECRKKVKT